MGKSEDRKPGVSTEPGANYMDKVQQSVQETGEGPNGEIMNESVETGKATDAKESKPKNEVHVNKSAIEFIEPEPEPEPEQVEDPTVIFVPHKDFEARVNQERFTFRKDVPTRVTRDLANMLLEDRGRGYVKD